MAAASASADNFHNGEQLTVGKKQELDFESCKNVPGVRSAAYLK